MQIVDERKRDFFVCENSIIDREDLKPSERLIYICLVRFADYNSRTCFPSEDKLLTVTGIKDKRTLRRWINSLEEKGLIEVKRDNGKSNFYVLKECKPVANFDTGSIETPVTIFDTGSKKAVTKNDTTKNDTSGISCNKPVTNFADTSDNFCTEPVTKNDTLTIPYNNTKEQHQLTTEKELVVCDELFSKAVEEAKKIPGVKNPEIYAKGMISKGWTPESGSKKSKPVDTIGPEWVDINDPKLKEKAFKEVTISQEQEERAIEMLIEQGYSREFLMKMKQTPQVYNRTLNGVLKSVS